MPNTIEPAPAARESARIAALRRYRILDTPPERSFDDLAELAAQICETPVAFISLVEEDRQWFKSMRGLSARETPRSYSFCAHTIGRPNEILEVADATADERFSTNPYVQGPPRLRFYAGAPLVSADENVLGTVGVMDVRPKRLTPAQRAALMALARQAMRLLELRLTVAELSESRRRLENAQRIAHIGDWVFDVTSGRLSWSEEVFRIFGVDADLFVPSAEGFYALVHPEDRERCRSINEAALRGENSGRTDHEHRIVQPDGRVRWVHERAEVIFGADGRAARLAGTVCDITERKQLEAQYLRAQRLESIGALAGGIAHDLNNVLTPIIMSVELLRRVAPDDESRQLIDAVAQSAQRGAELVKQVLVFARGAENRRDLIDLRRPLGEVVRIARETFPRNITVRVTVAPDLWPVLGDATQIHQVLLNLAVNARDAMPAGGTLSLSAANVRLDAQYAATSREAAPGPYVVLSVEDNGSGMPPAVLERAFEPFFTTKEPGRGTGLGLATSQAIARSHGGFITAYSEVGRGTTFRLYLPAHDGVLAPSPVPLAVAALPRGEGETVLVVDDEESVRLITKQTLEAFGYRVLLARDGAEAVATFVAKRARVDLILTDMMMPVMDGAAAINAVRHLDPHVPIVAASGLAGTREVIRPEGVQRFLAKPYAADLLLRTLRAVLDEGRNGPRGDDAAVSG
jgi:two-component system cell cycle sensor histidine kinase/response regulator CckA